MVSASSTRSILALVLLAGSAAAEKALKLGLTSDPRFSHMINAKLTNTGTERLKVLNDSSGVLNRAPTNMFSFASKDATAPSFTGMKLKYSPNFAATNGDDSAFTMLKPGESVMVQHDLSKSYKFAAAESSYSIGAAKTFYYWDDSTQELGTIEAKVVSASAKISARDLKPNLSTRAPAATNAKFSKCTASQQAAVAKATQFADVLANISAASLLKNVQNGGPLYQLWFGAFASARYNNATTHYTNITKNPFSNYTYDCTPEDCPGETTFAYVFPDQFGTIYLCNAFWQTTLVGTDSQAGTLIHESTHFLAIAGTDDIVYGRKGALELAATSPQLALGNADNHEYFSENLFTLVYGNSTGK